MFFDKFMHLHARKTVRRVVFDMNGLVYEEKSYLEEECVSFIFPETSHAYASVLDDS